MEPRAVAAEVTEAVRAEFGERLRAALLYGSVARGEHVPGISNVNVLFLLDDIDPATLRRAAPVARRFAGQGIAPLLLEWDEWRRASDVFAIELLDMIDAHEMLNGDDPLDGLAVQPAALRLQAEHELRSKLILLHDGMLRTADEPARLGTLLVTALPAFVTYLRAALRLGGRPVPGGAGEVIETGAALVGAEPDGLLRAYEARQKGGEWSVAIDDEVVDRYHTAVELTARFVDTIGREPT